MCLQVGRAAGLAWRYDDVTYVYDDVTPVTPCVFTGREGCRVSMEVLRRQGRGRASELRANYLQGKFF